MNKLKKTVAKSANEWGQSSPRWHKPVTKTAVSKIISLFSLSRETGFADIASALHMPSKV